MHFCGGGIHFDDVAPRFSLVIMFSVSSLEANFKLRNKGTLGTL